MTVRYLLGDTREMVAGLPDQSVDLVLVSPPFLALRSYLPADHPDKGREIGGEADPGAFIDVLLDLVEEWDRVLAPHGSICVELGDTYSGSGGAGGDYNDGGLRDGQNAFEGSARRTGGWPQAKSLCLIPESFRWALAYGRNPFTGRTTPSWRVRNVVRWCRPNPPVGALGDKWRPATSDLVIACKSSRRYWDDLATRKPHQSDPTAYTGNGYTKGSPEGVPGNESMPGNPGGVPLNDWWKVSTASYSGSHYAVMPEALAVPPILAMCPERVCLTCGEPSRRITEPLTLDSYRQSARPQTRRAVAMADDAGLTDEHIAAVRAFGTSDAGKAQVLNSGNGHNTDEVKRLAVEAKDVLGGYFREFVMNTNASRESSWSDCGHGSYRCRTCKVLVPFDHAVQGSGKPTPRVPRMGAEAILGESIQVAGKPSDDTGNMRGVFDRVHGPGGGSLLHQELFGAAGTHGGQSELDRGDRSGEPDMEGRAQSQQTGLRPDVGPDGHARTPQERIHDGAPTGDATGSATPTGIVGDRPSSERSEGRQSSREPGDCDAGSARGDRDMPALSEQLPGQLTGWRCPGCNGGDLEYFADHWRPGLVLDPFGGSGTTGAVAQGLGRDAILVDLDERNLDLARQRIGMFLTTEPARRPL